MIAGETQLILENRELLSSDESDFLGMLFRKKGKKDKPKRPPKKAKSKKEKDPREKGHWKKKGKEILDKVGGWEGIKSTTDGVIGLFKKEDGPTDNEDYDRPEEKKDQTIWWVLGAVGLVTVGGLIFINRSKS